MRFFSDPEFFHRGLICEDFLDCPDFNLRQQVPTDFANLRNYLQPLLLKTFHGIWEERNKQISQRGWSLGSRTKTVFGISQRRFSDALLNSSIVLTPVQQPVQKHT
jgi:hypothetical protein